MINAMDNTKQYRKGLVENFLSDFTDQDLLHFLQKS